MSRPHAAGSAVQPNAASTAQPSGNVAAQPYAQTSAAALAPRLDPIPIPTPFAAPFHPLGAPPPAPGTVPYPAPFHHTWRPPFFPPVMPPGAFPGPSVYRLPPPPPSLFGPYPGAPFLPHVNPRYFTQYPIRPGPPGSPRSIMYPPGVFSYQQPAVVHEIVDPVAAARPPLPPVAPQFKVYIGKIASTVDKDFVLSLLQVCGPVKSWEPVTNPIDGTPTAFGFCEFEFAEGSLRARRLLNKLSVDGQELVLNVNQATRDYGESTIEEKANEADMDAIQKIRSLIEERMKSKLPGSPIPPVQMSASASIVDENDDGGTGSSALEETKIRRQCEKEEHLGESKAVGLEDRKDREATAARKSSLQVDAAATGECLQKYGQSTAEEKANEVGKDVTQEIHSTIEERMTSKFPGSLSPPIQVSASIVDANGDADSRSIALEERKIRRQCEEVHLGERKAAGLQCWKDKEVTAPGPGNSSLQIDGASTMYAPMECESTVENGRKSQHMERDGFHKSNGKKRHIVFVPGVFSDDESSGAGEKVGCELEATAKSGDNKTLNAKQLLGTVPKTKEELKQPFATVPKTKEELKELLATVPKTKEELFIHDVNWAIYDEHGLHERMRPWISRKSTEVIGEELPEFVDYVVETTKEHVDAPRMVELLLSLLDEYAERFVLLMWRKLIFEIKRVETELA